MSAPFSPRLLRGGIVILDPESGRVRRVVELQYNPDTLTRTLQPQGVPEGGDRAEAMRLKGPPVETIKLEAELDVTDALERPDENPQSVEQGLYPQLAALEALVYPDSGRLQSNHDLQALGTLEILGAPGPLTLFVWSKQRVLPVRLTDITVTEEAFDPNLNPIRARISLGMRVLNINDVPYGSKGGSLSMAHHQTKERLAASTGGDLARLGIRGVL
jgi:hypothetical protein